MKLVYMLTHSLIIFQSHSLFPPPPTLHSHTRMFFFSLSIICFIWKLLFRLFLKMIPSYIFKLIFWINLHAHTLTSHHSTSSNSSSHPFLFFLSLSLSFSLLLFVSFFRFFLFRLSEAFDVSFSLGWQSEMVPNATLFWWVEKPGHPFRKKWNLLKTGSRVSKLPLSLF